MTTNRLLRFLLRRNRGTLVWMILAGALAGLFSAALLAVINQALQSRADLTITTLAAAFIGLMLGKIATSFVSQVLLVRFSQQTVLELSIELSERLLRAPLRVLEARGSGRLLSTLTDDVSALTWTVQVLPQLAMNVAIVMGCGLWLAWLAPTLFATAAVAAAAGAWGYALLNRRAFKVIYAAREARTRLFDRFGDLTGGLKELMMHGRRRDEFLQVEIRGAADDYRRTNLRAALHYAVADAWTQVLYYGLIGALLFAVPAVVQPSSEALTGYVLAMLFMLGPIWSIIGAVPTVSRGQVALRQIEELGGALPDSPVSGSTQHFKPGPIRLSGIEFSYPPGEDGHGGFKLGPVDFELLPGQLIFVVGGNGSGKSTFVKVLTGLYPAETGDVFVGEQCIDKTQADSYRDLFSVVFADFYLFRRFLGLPDQSVAQRAQEYLRRLDLERKVEIGTDGFSTLALSQGQRKRLALVTAWLEDRPFYVFDEWAADQDPEYKSIFYETLLPELRSRGKGVVVITHDDRYFHLGDRVMKLDDGRVVANWSGAEQLAVGARQSLV